MSTTIKSVTTERSLRVITVAGLGVSLGHLSEAGVTTSAIYVNQADLLAALRAEGVLEDDGLRGRVEAVAAKLENTGWNVHGQVATDLREALNPTPPYQFPTGLGAVIEGKSVQGGMTDRFTHTQPKTQSWVSVSSGSPWNEGEIRESFTNLHTLSEGLGL